MNGLKSLKENLFAKAFHVELEEIYCYPNDKNFQFPSHEVVVSALEKYAQSNNMELQFIDKEKRILFLINGKNKYEAKLELGRGRYNQGYAVNCRQIFE